MLPAPLGKYTMHQMPLQEKGKVLKLALTLLCNSRGMVLPEPATNGCFSLVPVGTRVLVGMNGRPLFERPHVVQKHPQCLQPKMGINWQPNRIPGQPWLQRVQAT